MYELLDRRQGCQTSMRKSNRDSNNPPVLFVKAEIRIGLVQQTEYCPFPRLVSHHQKSENNTNAKTVSISGENH